MTEITIELEGLRRRLDHLPQPEPGDGLHLPWVRERDRVKSRISFLEGALAALDSYGTHVYEGASQLERTRERLRMITPKLPDSVSFERALEELERGETLNALAQFRRALELAFRDILAREDRVPPRTSGAGQLLKTMQRKGLVPSGSDHHMSYAIAVANRAIHGEEMNVEQGREAISGGIRALAEILDSLQH